MKILHFIDSHTGGEPTRLVTSGGPDLGDGTLAERLENLRTKHDDWRAGVVTEPRGSDVIVGALLCEPDDPACAAAVIFFNNVGYLGMCGHGTIGLIVSLAYLGKIQPGSHRIQTPAGIVEATLHQDGSGERAQRTAYRYRQAVHVDVDGYGSLTGDIAWGGNWFFLVADHGQDLVATNLTQLTAVTDAIRNALQAQGITGADAAVIDHIELFADSPRAGIDSRNFVLCPGSAYDRSPCGTGTSAKVACLAADNKLAEGEVWRQESIIGSVFEASYRHSGETRGPGGDPDHYRDTRTSWPKADLLRQHRPVRLGYPRQPERRPGRCQSRSVQRGRCVFVLRRPPITSSVPVVNTILTDASRLYNRAQRGARPCHATHVAWAALANLTTPARRE